MLHFTQKKTTTIKFIWKVARYPFNWDDKELAVDFYVSFAADMAVNAYVNYFYVQISELFLSVSFTEVSQWLHDAIFNYCRHMVRSGTNSPTQSLIKAKGNQQILKVAKNPYVTNEWFDYKNVKNYGKHVSRTNNDFNLVDSNYYIATLLLSKLYFPFRWTIYIIKLSTIST